MSSDEAHAAGAPTAGGLVADAAARLSEAGAPDPARDAARLWRHAIAGDDPAYAFDRSARVSEAVSARYAALVARRARREPLTQITGTAGFWTLDLQVTADVLAPRPETEHLVEALLVDDGVTRGRVLDLGVGSGAILLAVLAERPGFWGVGVDLSPAALGVARANAKALGLSDRAQFVCADWTSAIEGTFDLIASNPPYIRSGDIEALEPEVRDHEPRLALDGGPDGVAPYRVLVPQVCAALTPGGRAAFEIAPEHWSDIRDLIVAAAPNRDVTCVNDLSGRARVVTVGPCAEF